MPPHIHPDPWETAPIVWTEPDPDSPEAFNEDEFVALWNEWYSLLLEIRHIRRDQVVFPPQDTGRHPNLHTDRLYGDLGMSPEAVSLVERLPYLIDGDDWHFLPEAIGLSYLRPDHLDICRDPHDMAQFSTGVSHDPPSSTDGIYMLPHDVALTIPYEGEGSTWILDLKYNAFRIIGGMVENPDRGHWRSQFTSLLERPDDAGKKTPLERAEDIHHYRNWATYHAPSVLRNAIRDLKNCVRFPYLRYWAYPWEPRYLVLGKALRKYGWPNSFRGEAWSRDLEGNNRALDELMKALEASGMKDEVAAQWQRSPDLIPDLGSNSE